MRVTAVMVSAIWAVTLLIVIGFLAWRLSSPLKSYLEADSQARELKNQEWQLGLDERRAQLALAEQTKNARAEAAAAEQKLKAAELNLEAAEKQLDSELVGLTRKARLEEAEAVIAARTEARVLAAREAGLNIESTPHGPNPEIVTAVLEAYADYCNRIDDIVPTLHDWLGNRNLMLQPMD